MQIMQHTHTHKAMTGRIEAKKLLSRQRQSETRCKHHCQLEIVQKLVSLSVTGELGSFSSYEGNQTIVYQT